MQRESDGTKEQHPPQRQRQQQGHKKSICWRCKVISEVKVQGDEVIYEELKCKERERCCTREQQQSQRQQQPAATSTTEAAGPSGSAKRWR